LGGGGHPGGLSNHEDLLGATGVIVAVSIA